MKNWIISYFDKLTNLGYEDHFDEYQETSNMLVNQIQIFITFFVFLFILKDFFSLNPDVFTTLGIFAIMISFFFFRERMSYLFAIVFQLSICLVAVTIEYYIHNQGLRVEPLYITILALGILSLSKPIHKVILVVITLSCYVGVDIFIRNVGLYMQSGLAPEDNLSIFIFAMSMMGVITYRYIYLIKRMMLNKNMLLEDVRSKNGELERFAYITSHDLKQPLRNIGSFAGLMRRYIDQPEKTEKNIEYLTEIENSANRMSLMIEDILSFSKIDKTEIVIEDVDLVELVEDFKRSHSELLKENKASIDYSNLPVVSGNKIYFSLLFQNLFENGIKYNKSGNPLIAIKSSIKNNNYMIRVRDNGIGISQEFSRAIFEPFKRLHSNRTYEGTGLGLSICKKIVETYNGQLWIETDENTPGTTFVVSIPIK